jgi:hypothetical protein
MNQHLSPDEIAAGMLGDRTAEYEQHLSECPHCREQATRLESTLAEFRTGVRQWSARQTPAILSSYRPSRAWFPARWIMVAAMLLLVAGSTYWQLARRRAEDRARQDALLLEQVDSGISRAVPEPMEPLVKLVSWGTGPATSNTHKESR